MSRGSGVRSLARQGGLERRALERSTRGGKRPVEGGERGSEHQPVLEHLPRELELRRAPAEVHEALPVGCRLGDQSRRLGGWRRVEREYVPKPRGEAWIAVERAVVGDAERRREPGRFGHLVASAP